MARKRNRRRGNKRATGKGLSTKEKKQVKKIIDHSSEKKFLSIVVPQTGFQTVLPVVFKLNAAGANGLPPQGTGDQNRIGDDIKWISLRLQLYVHLDNAATIGHFGRFIIFQWHQNDEVQAPTAGTILLPGIGGVPGYESQYAEDTKPLFTILYDRTFSVGINGNSFISITKNVTIKRKRVRFLTGSATNTATNNIYILSVGDGVASEQLVYFLSAKIKYTDI